MTSQTPDIQAVLERLEKLERQNRWLKRVSIGVLLLACVGLLMGQASPSRTVEAELFVVKGGAGGMSIELTAGPGSATVVFYDAAGLERLALDADSRDTCIKLWDNAARHMEESGVTLCQTASNGPSLQLTDRQNFQAHRGAVSLVTAQTGETHKRSAASLVMFGKDRKVIWHAP